MTNTTPTVSEEKAQEPVSVDSDYLVELAGGFKRGSLPVLEPGAEIPVGKTKFGKEIVLRRTKQKTAWEFVMKGGGNKPKALSGIFTNLNNAAQAARKVDLK